MTKPKPFDRVMWAILDESDDRWADIYLQRDTARRARIRFLNSDGLVIRKVRVTEVTR